MAYEAPSAPAKFLDAPLDNMIANLAADARLVLINSATVDPNAGWAEVGVADDSTMAGTNVGTAVLGYADIGTLPTKGDGDAEGTGEMGRKLTFTGVNGVGILENKADTSMAMAIVQNVATFAGGSDADVEYIIDMQDLPVDGTPTGVTVNVPEFFIECQYGTNKP